MKKRKYVYGFVLLSLLCWVGFQMYWYLQNNGNMIISVSNGTHSLKSAEIKIYIDDKLVSESEYQNDMLFGELRTFTSKLNFGCHKITAETKNESNIYEKEIKICTGLSFVRWVNFELIGEPSFYDENGKPINTFILPSTPFDTIPQHDIQTVYEYEFLVRTSLFPLRFE